MKKILFSIVMVLVLIIKAASIGAITWGTPDSEHTSVGAIVVDHPVDGLFQLCSGVLIHPRVLLTAGHCTNYLEPLEITSVRVNFSDYAFNESTLLEVEEVITHPDYYWGPVSNPHDVGILILAEPVEDIEPATLPYEGFLNNLKKGGSLDRGGNKSKFTVVGYGGMLEWPPPKLLYNDERQSAVSEYRALLKAWLRVSQNQATGDGGTCYGDSGGPVFWRVESDGITEILVGITSWGDARCVAAGFNYRVDIPETLNFIDEVIGSLE